MPDDYKDFDYAVSTALWKLAKGIFRTACVFVVILAAYIVFVALSTTYVPSTVAATVVIIIAGSVSALYAAWMGMTDGR